MIKRLFPVTCSLLLGSGCSSEAATVPLCDGSTNLTLRIFHGGQSSRGYLGSGVREENGHPSFAVDGQCRYFISGGWVADQQSRDLGWREGVVSNDLRRALEARAGAEDLEARWIAAAV
jgi:hypothetical protein